MAEIDRLTLEIEDKASSSTEGIDSLITKLQTLNKAVSPTVTGLNRLSNAFTKLESATKTLQSVRFNNLNTAMSQMSTSFSKIEQATATFENTTRSIKNMASAMNALLRSMNKLSANQSQVGNIDLSYLTSQTQNLSSLGTLSQSLTQLRDGAKSITTLTKSFDNLNKVDFQKTLQSVKQLSTVLQNLKDATDNFAESSDNIKLMASALNALNRAMQKVAQTSSGSNLNLNGLNLTVNKYAAGMANMGGSNMFSGATDILSMTQLVREAGNAFGYLLNQSNKYIETMNLCEVVMGSATQQGWEFISALESIGIDMEEAMRYQASFYDIAKSMGVTADNAYTLSEQMTKLSYDYASLYNQSPDDMFYKLSAAITGELEPVRRLGKDISEAALAQTALNLGINESVRNMTQAEKAELRFITLMSQSTAAMNDMERTIMSPANALRILRAQFTSLARELGNLFIPILQAVLPWLIAIVQFIRQLVADIAGFFGIEMASIDFSGIDTQVQSIGAGTGDVADNLGGAADNAKKLKDYMLGIDELNVLNEDGSVGRDTGASAGVGAGGGGGLGVDLDDFGYDELLKDVEDRASEILAIFNKWKPLLLTIAGILGTIWAVGKVVNFINALRGVQTTSTLVAGTKGLAGLATAFFNLAGSGGILGAAATAFVTLGDKALMSIGIMTGSTTIAGITGLGLVFAGVAVAGYGIYTALQPSIKSIDVLNGVSEETKSKLEPVIESWENLDKTMNKINWKGVIDNADITYIQQQVDTMAQSVLNELDADRNQELADLNMLSGLESVTAEQYQSMLDSTNEYYDQVQQETEEAQEAINEILAKYSDQNIAMTEEDQQELSRLYGIIGENAVTAMSESAQEQQQILDRLKYNKLALEIESGAELLSQAKQNYDDQMTEAQDWKARMLKNLDDKFYNEGTITKEEYDKQLAAINSAYDEMIADNESTYDDIEAKIKESLGEDARYIDWETGKIKSNWQIWLEDLGSLASWGWNSITSGISSFVGSVASLFGSVVDTVVSAWNGFWSFDWVGPLWDGISGAISSIGSKIGSFFNDNVIQPLKDKWDGFWGGLGRYANQFDLFNPGTWISWSSMNPVDPVGLGYQNGPDVTFFAKGGFVPRNASFISPSSSLWTAGEAGNEMVGNFRGRTTVMPLQDTEFVTAMYDAVYRAVRDSIDSANSNNPPTPIYVNVDVGGKQISKAVEDYKYASGTSLIKRR